MIAFGCVVGSDEEYGRLARPSLERFAEPDAVVVERRDQNCIHRAYNSILDEVRERPDLEAVVLLHEDVRIARPEFCALVREHLADPDVAVVGTVGASRVRSLAWWEGVAQGQVTWDWLEEPALHALVDPELLQLGPGGPPTACDVVDGLMLVLSPWAARKLRFDEELGPSFHGYDVDICFQARAAGKRVVAASLPVVHCTTAAITGRASWVRVYQAFARKWGL